MGVLRIRGFFNGNQNSGSSGPVILVSFRSMLALPGLADGLLAELLVPHL
jgi:hypothetical protein